MSNLAIIPARGGSKRIPGKNIKEFLGKPIITYSINAALESGLFDEVMVSTDSEEIAQLAIQYGAKVPFLRSEKNSDDFATTASVLKEVVTNYLKDNRVFEYMCGIYPCAPFIDGSILTKAFSLLKSGYDSVIPVVAYSYPVQRALRIKGQNIDWAYDEYADQRSQDLETYYHDCGQFYWLSVSKFMSDGGLIMENSGFVERNEIVVQDIDNETDWKLAELKYKLTYGMADEI